MINYRLVIQYDGTDFCGWQVQGTGERTVQGELDRVLSLLDDRAVTIHGAGRTDTGVHAEGQVATVLLQHDFQPWHLQAAMNGNLPHDIRITCVDIVPDRFNARHEAKGKTYRYRIVNAKVMPPAWRRFALREGRRLDLDAMRACIPLLIGRHDFTAFASAKVTVLSRIRDLTTLTIDVETVEGIDGQLITITIGAAGFIRYMARGIAGALLAVGRGEFKPEAITQALESGIRPQGFNTAKAHGLTLMKVHYD